MGVGIMLIRTFVLKVTNNERKKLTHHGIIDRIAEQTKSLKCAKNQNCGFIRSDEGHVSHLRIHLNSLINVL